MSEVSKDLKFISHTGEEITWLMVLMSEEDEIDAISSDNRIVSIFNATSIGVGAAGTGENGTRSESFWFDVLGHHSENAYNDIIAIRKLIERDKECRISKGVSYKNWHRDAISFLSLIAEDPQLYSEALDTGFESYFQIKYANK